MPYFFEQDRLSVGRTDSVAVFTTDAGVTWTIVNPGPGAQVAVDDLILYGVRTRVSINGANKPVRRSPDGGATWVNIGVDPQAGRENRGIARLSTGRLLIPVNFVGPGNLTEIVYSDDEGATWTLVNIDPAMTVGSGTYNIWRVASDVLLLHMRGTVGGVTRNRLYRSTDGGVSWAMVLDTGNASDVVGGLYHDIVGNVIIVQVGRQAATFLNIYRSINNGVSFTLVYAPVATQLTADVNHPYKSKIVRGDRFLYCVGPTANSLARSSDNGATWVSVTPAGLIYGGTGGGMFRTRNRLFIVGSDTNNGNVSTDDGDTWAPAPANLGNANRSAAMLDPLFIGGSKAKKMGGAGVAGFSPGLAPPFIPARR